MVRLVHLCAFASSWTFTAAVRVTNDAETALEEGDVTAPTVLTDGVRESEIRHCALFHFQAYEEVVGGCNLPGEADAMTLAIAEIADPDLALVKADEDSLAA